MSWNIPFHPYSSLNSPKSSHKTGRSSHIMAENITYTDHIVQINEMVASTKRWVNSRRQKIFAPKKSNLFFVLFYWNYEFFNYLGVGRTSFSTHNRIEKPFPILIFCLIFYWPWKSDVWLFFCDSFCESWKASFFPYLFSQSLVFFWDLSVWFTKFAVDDVVAGFT